MIRKKIISSILALSMIVSIFTGIPMSVNAADIVKVSAGNTKVSMEIIHRSGVGGQQKFPKQDGTFDDTEQALDNILVKVFLEGTTEGSVYISAGAIAMEYDRDILTVSYEDIETNTAADEGILTGEDASSIVQAAVTGAHYLKAVYIPAMGSYEYISTNHRGRVTLPFTIGSVPAAGAAGNLDSTTGDVIVGTKIGQYVKTKPTTQSGSLMLHPTSEPTLTKKLRIMTFSFALKPGAELKNDSIAIYYGDQGGDPVSKLEQFQDPLGEGTNTWTTKLEGLPIAFSGDLPYAYAYDLNGGTGGTTPADVNALVSGTAVKAAEDPGSTKEGSAFVKWNTASVSDNGTSYSVGADLPKGTPGTKTTLYAQYGTPDPTYTITYDKNNTCTTGDMNTATAPAASSGVVSGGSVTTLPTMTVAGWTFGGWYNEAGCTSQFANSGITASKTVYAKWTAIPVALANAAMTDGTYGEVYTYSLATSVSAGTPSGTHTYALTTGTLPAGLTLAAATGVISGTPTPDPAGTDVTGLVFTVTDLNGTTATGTFSILIQKAAGLAITTTLTPTAPTTNGGVDGKIGGTTALMEWSTTSNFASANDCSAADTTVGVAGTYYVRTKATSTHNAGAAKEVVVPSYSASALTGTAQFKSGTGTAPTFGTKIESELSGTTATATQYTIKWSRSAEGANSGYAEIAGATAADYTPIVADVGRYLKVEYTGNGTDFTGSKSVTTSAAVAAKTQSAGFAINEVPALVYATPIDTDDITTSGGESGEATIAYTITAGTETATVANGKLTPTKAGNITITATKSISGYTDATATKQVVIAKADAAITASNLNQTVVDKANTVAVAATFTPDDTASTAATITVHYWIVKSAATGEVNCNCGVGNALAHATDCEKVTDTTHVTNCDCYASADSTVAAETVHTGSCPAKVKGNDDAKCDCGAGNANAVAPGGHTSCAYAAATGEEKGWATWSGGAEAYIKENGADTYKIAYSTTGSDNINAITAPTAENESKGNLVVAVNAGGGGGGIIPSTVDVKEISISPEKISAGVGDLDVTLKATIKPENATNKNLTWSSSDEKIVKVNKDGVLTFIGAGEATITAKASNGVMATVAVVVSNKAESLMNRDFMQGYVKGYEDGTFGPENFITRAETAAIFARILNKPFDETMQYSSNFNDVESNSWYANYIGFLTEHDVLSGYSDGTFKPKGSITRAEMASIIFKIEGMTASETKNTKLTDIGDVEWAEGYLTTLVEKGIFDGYADNTIRPNAKITRAETIVLINRLLKNAEVKDGSNIKPSDVDESYWAYGDILKAMNERVLAK